MWKSYPSDIIVHCGYDTGGGELKKVRIVKKDQYFLSKPVMEARSRRVNFFVQPNESF